MSILKIIRTEASGEACWRVQLHKAKDGPVLMRTASALTKDEAQAVAKQLRHQGRNVASTGDASPDAAGLITILGDEFKFRLDETEIEMVSANGDIELALGILAEAEISWHDPNDDPSKHAKDADRTQPKGLQGS